MQLTFCLTKKNIRSSRKLEEGSSEGVNGRCRPGASVFVGLFLRDLWAGWRGHLWHLRNQVLIWLARLLDDQQFRILIVLVLYPAQERENVHRKPTTGYCRCRIYFSITVLSKIPVVQMLLLITPTGSRPPEETFRKSLNPLLVQVSSLQCSTVRSRTSPETLKILNGWWQNSFWRSKVNWSYASLRVFHFGFRSVLVVLFVVVYWFLCILLLLDGRVVVLKFWIQVFASHFACYLGQATPVCFESGGPALGVTQPGHVSIPSVTNLTQVWVTGGSTSSLPSSPAALQRS